MTVVITTSPGFGKYGRVSQKLTDLGWEFIRCNDPDLKDGGVSQHIARADFLVSGLLPVTSSTLNNALNLKGVLKHGVGIDNIDIQACSARKIPVLNTPGANADAVAELAIGMMFALARNIPAAHASLISGKWERKIGSQLGGKKLGVVGLGNIGKALALKARALGMSVMATDPYANIAFAKANDIEIVNLNTLLATSDYVSLHIFGGKENINLINAEQLKLMKPTACLLNLARGEVVNLDAAATALNAETLGGIAIDAYASEPPDVSHPIFTHSRAIFTPHSGADTIEALENVGLMNITDIQSIMNGKMPDRILNKEIYA